MFERAFVENGQKRSRSWSVASSFLLQSLVICFVTLLPFVSTHRLPAARWVGFLVAPPPARRAADPPADPEGPRKRLTPKRVDPSVFQAPTAIPDKIAIVVDDRMEGPPVNLGSQIGVGVPGGTGEGIPGGIMEFLGPSRAVAPPPKPVIPKPPKAKRETRLLVSSGVQEAKLIKRVTPVYSPLARQARISGVVRLEAIIAKDGAIRSLRVVSGHPLLVGSALAAVRQWRYRPTRLNEEAVEVVTHIDVHYLLR